MSFEIHNHLLLKWQNDYTEQVFEINNFNIRIHLKVTIYLKYGIGFKSFYAYLELLKARVVNGNCNKQALMSHLLWFY